MRETKLFRQSFVTTTPRRHGRKNGNHRIHTEKADQIYVGSSSTILPPFASGDEDMLNSQNFSTPFCNTDEDTSNMYEKPASQHFVYRPSSPDVDDV